MTRDEKLAIIDMARIEVTTYYNGSILAMSNNKDKDADLFLKKATQHAIVAHFFLADL